MYVSLEAAPSTIKIYPWCLCHSDPHFGVKDLTSCYLYPPRYPQCCSYGQTRPHLNSLICRSEPEFVAGAVSSRCFHDSLLPDRWIYIPWLDLLKLVSSIVAWIMGPTASSRGCPFYNSSKIDCIGAGFCPEFFLVRPRVIHCFSWNAICHSEVFNKGLFPVFPKYPPFASAILN